MQLKNLILGTSALIGVGILAAGAAAPVKAAEVLPGGALDLTISGFARFLAAGGQLDDARLDDDVSRRLDFRNDTEVHVLARAKSEEYGTEYGGTIEFEADTNRTDNTDETWIFLSGGWGEVRLGDEDGVADNSSVGAQVIAAGTGGIDGTVVDTISTGVVYLTNTSDATKIRYYTPSFGGFSVGVDYTPNLEIVNSGALNGDLLATKDAQAKNVVEGGLIYDGEFGGTAILASVVGVWGDLKESGEEAFGGDDWWGWQAGASVDLFGFKLAGNYADEKVGEQEKSFFTAGVGAALGPVNTSVTYGQVVDSEGLGLGDPYNLVFSADYALMPGLVLAGDVSVFDNDATDEQLEVAGTGDQGWQAVARLGLAF